MGHKTKRGVYRDWITDEGLIKLEGWARDGLVDSDIAHNIGIHVSTLYVWKKKYPEIDESLKRGKEVVDRIVENALFNNAVGFEYTEVDTTLAEYAGEETETRVEKIKQALPNTTAQIFWLKNRKPDEWRDRKETNITGEIDVSDQSAVIESYLLDDGDDNDTEE